ncbi:MAG: response regulator transcription factor [Planctomycetota bacterium]
MAEKILICDDEPDVVAGLEHTLAGEGYDVVTALNGKDGLQKAMEEAPDFVVLDVMMPGMDGVAVCEELRRRGVKTPVIMLTAKDTEAEKVRGLEAGADDYVTKPFGTRELLARISAVGRRYAGGKEKIREFSFGDVTVDFDHQTVTRGGETTRLSSCESELLRLLVMRRGEAVSREAVLTEVWGYEYPPDTRTIDNHVVRLRQKIEDDPHAPQHLLTAHGVGYKFVD